jgi:dolichyl-phosphate-mannose-protein mannosyltransferase
VISTAEPLLPAQSPTWFDRWRTRLSRDPSRERMLRWLAPALVTLLAGLLRFVNLGEPQAIVFDETYYVKDSWSQWMLGYPATWPDGADERFAAGETDIYTTTGSYVVHPPLARILIGAGMALFGPASSFGWRFSVALFGTATVLVLYLLARTLTRSTAFATVAALLFAVDGLAIVMSRIALLDGILTFFVVLTFWFVALDRVGHLDRLARLLVSRTAAEGGAPAWGPVSWARPWLLAAGIAAGAACAVKWSGVYVLAAVGIYAVVSDALARRRAGVTFWPLDAVRQGAVSFLLLVPPALVIYLWSWTGWLVTDGGYSRHVADASPAQGFWAWVPVPLQNLWSYHQAMYGFHVGLSSPHSYASPAWQWPFLVRPTSMWWHQDDAGANGCTLPTGCTEAVSSLANPILWWAGVVAVLYLLVRVVLTREWRYALVLTGVAATYVPWLLFPGRTIFQFYTVVILPFMVLAIVFALRDIIGGRDAPPIRRANGQRLAAAFVIVVLLVSVFWYPVWTALPVPYEFWRVHNWLSSWI